MQNEKADEIQITGPALLRNIFTSHRRVFENRFCCVRLWSVRAMNFTEYCAEYLYQLCLIYRGVISGFGCKLIQPQTILIKHKRM
jgi:hypothetical protein